jgi:hypothetical protein
MFSYSTEVVRSIIRDSGSPQSGSNPFLAIFFLFSALIKNSDFDLVCDFNERAFRSFPHATIHHRSTPRY